MFNCISEFCEKIFYTKSVFLLLCSGIRAMKTQMLKMTFYRLRLYLAKS